jgi:cytochrome c heme-lyase
MSETPGVNESNRNSGRCPVDNKEGSFWPIGKNSIDKGSSKECSSDSMPPASIEEAAKHAQTPHADQLLPLSTYRSTSSISRGVAETSPHHQPSGADSKWVYPSEQQVFNAMKRKGWQGVEETSMPSFLQIHNSVNERSWAELCKWESNDDIKLVRFQGRPNTLTPKAWFMSTFLFQDKPFDRHDWYIDNGTNHEKRYVLDFYMRESTSTGMPRVEVEVRPALDSPQAVFASAKRLTREAFPGIAKALKDMQAAN